MGSQAREVVAEDFYPRPPRGGRLPDGKGTTAGTVFLSTPSARRATLRVSAVFALVLVISIHALREEGDLAAPSAPVSAMAFLSTPSARRATPTGCFSWPHLAISIHALCEEGDSTKPELESSLFSFLSTPSARRATRRQDAMHLRLIISIHALREEGDRCLPQLLCNVLRFLSTPSARRATIEKMKKSQTDKFLSTPSARRATVRNLSPPFDNPYFYPRPPRGGRPPKGGFLLATPSISIHALREEGDTIHHEQTARATTISIHALREEGDSWGLHLLMLAHKFLSTPSARRATAKTEKNISAFVSL